mmetsp:Transcript_63661/g.88479  ORF Transcript_63661/g.88479 Transcript_63661/m.88479 type:complete len:94 (-) Transcript_63661:352-633(-)|eukprot:s519_g11.t1
MDTAPLRLSAALCIEPPSTRLLNKHGIPKEKKQPAVIPGLAEQRGGVPGSTPRVDASTPPGLIAHVHFEDQMNVDVQMGSRPRATSLILFCKF